MAVQNVEGMLLQTLSNIHQREMQLAQFWDQLSQQIHEPDVKESVIVRAYFTRQDANNIEKCFELLGKQMPQPDTRFAQIMLEDFRREYDSIQNPRLQAVYALWTVRKIQNFVMGEYAGLTVIARAAGQHGVADLLAHNLADKMDYIERTRDWFRDAVRQAIGARVGAAMAA